AAEDRVLTVEPWGRGEGDEELAPIRAGAGVRRREHARAVVRDRSIVLAVDAVSGASRAGAERAPTLRHEGRDHPMEDEAVVEAEPGEDREARDMERGGLRQQANAEHPDARVHAREDARSG